MVRVLTAHHFASQDIQTCEDPVAVAAVPPDKLLIASADHVVEVRDLSKQGMPVSTFPTVELVQQMFYCPTGNFVVTLEGSQAPGHAPGQACVARVYSRWEHDPQGPQGPATAPRELRARIAGCVTPSPDPEDLAALDMIELRGGATALACCSATGNVLVASHRMLVLYRFLVRKHDSSRTSFIDFKDTEVRVSLSFPPVQTFLLEEMVACLGRHSLIVFRLWRGERGDRGDQIKPAAKAKETSTRAQPLAQDQTLSLGRILQLEQEVDSGRWPGGVEDALLPVTVQLPAIAAERASRGLCSPSSGVVHHSNPFVSDPAEVAANVFGEPSAKDPTASANFQVEALLRLQLAADPQGGHGEEFRCMALQPMYRRPGGDPASQGPAMAAVSDSRELGPGRRPAQTAARSVGPASWLHSPYRAELCGVACVAATQQEGYLYHFALDGSDGVDAAHHPCVAVYPFTAPVSRVALEPLALHALTETGLETYTLRSAHRTLAALQPACPPADDPICLIGLRPFLGARHLLASGPHLVLLASSDGGSPPPVPSGPGPAGASPPSPWTLYSLKMPTPEVLFSDMVAVGESHRVASPSTYCHLLGEAHCVLASARLLSDRPWAAPAAASPSVSRAAARAAARAATRVATPADETEEALEALYRESCAHLGDYHMLGDDGVDRDLAARYYRMARLGPRRVLDRLRRHAQRLGQPGERCGQDDDEAAVGAASAALSARLCRGQVHYLETEVLRHHQDDAAPDDQDARQLTTTLLDLLEKEVESAQSAVQPDLVPDAEPSVGCHSDSQPAPKPDRLALLALRARLLRDYAAARTLALLRASASSPPRDPTVVLALLVLEVQVGGAAGVSPEVLSALQAVPGPGLRPALLRHWELLVDSPSPGSGPSGPRAAPCPGPGLSELATVLMERRPADVADLLARLVADGTVPLARILKMMLDHLSAHIGSSGSAVGVVFQHFLETFFAAFFATHPVGAHMDLATEEALKILVRSYLSDLQAPSRRSSPLSPGPGPRLEPLPRVLLDEGRRPFLDLMPPFAPDLAERLASPSTSPTASPTVASPAGPQGPPAAKLLSLRKLQAVLCSGRLPPACLTEVLRFVHGQPELCGNLSLQALCLGPREAAALLLDFCPQAVLRHAQDSFRTEEDWRHLLVGLEAKLKTLEEGQPQAARSALYRQTMTDVLDHLARSVDVATLCRLLRLDAALDAALDPTRAACSATVRAHLPHLLTCQRVASANAVRDYIATTSAAFLAQLDHC